MWQLGLEEPSSYPERAGEPDCIYYLRTGFCGYADRCRFNHPRDRSTSAVRCNSFHYFLYDSQFYCLILPFFFLVT